MANLTILPPPRPQPKQDRLNAKQEHFCQGVAAGMRKMDAYAAAGYSGPYAESHMMRNPKIRARIRALLMMRAFKLDVTIDKLVLELAEAYEVAKKDINPQGMVVATLGKAKLLGFLQDRWNDEGKVPKPLTQPQEYREMSLEEWQEQFTPKTLQ
jgi:hypothetical protein